MLKVEDLCVTYGEIPALENITLSVKGGELVTVLGANGAGKTTLLNTIDGLIKPKSGSVMLKNKDVTRMASWERVRLGLGLVPEGGRVLPDLTVKENLRLGAYRRTDQKEVDATLVNVYELFPVLEERVNQQAGTLSGGEQQMVAIGRALMTEPELLLVDEVSMGLMPKLVNQVFTAITKLKERDLSVLLAEQNAKKALATVDRGYVLENGKIVLEGQAQELQGNDMIRKVYLGI